MLGVSSLPSRPICSWLSLSTSSWNVAPSAVPLAKCWANHPSLVATLMFSYSPHLRLPSRSPSSHGVIPSSGLGAASSPSNAQPMGALILGAQPMPGTVGTRPTSLSARIPPVTRVSPSFSLKVPPCCHQVGSRGVHGWRYLWNHC